MGGVRRSENKRGRECGNNSKMEEGFLSFFSPPHIISLPLFVIFSVFLVSSESAAWTQGRSGGGGGEGGGGGSSRERKCLSADGSPWLLLGPGCQLLFCHSMRLTGK